VTLWKRFYIFSGKIKLPIVEQIIRDAIEYDSYSTGELSSLRAMRPSLRGRSPSLRAGGLSEPEAGAEPGPAAKR
jgi:hypothetical protein